MAPRYQTNKGYNTYNANKRLFEETDNGQGHIPLIINKDFLNQTHKKNRFGRTWWCTA